MRVLTKGARDTRFSANEAIKGLQRSLQQDTHRKPRVQISSNDLLAALANHPSFHC